MLSQSTTPFGPAQEAIAAALHAASMTDREIAAEVGTSPGTITYWRKQNGLPENPPAGASKPAPAAKEPDMSVAPAPQRFQPPPPVRPPAQPGLLMPSSPSTYSPPPRHAVPQRGPRMDSVRMHPSPMLLEPDGVDPEGLNAIDMGLSPKGASVMLDLSELLMTRLLVQGNSGSGKSHLLRRLIEQTATTIQQVIIDPEGEFVSLPDMFNHTVINASGFKEAQLRDIGGRVRQHRGSVVLNLEGMDQAEQMTRAAALLDGMFDAPKEHWSPCLVIIDEAQVFAPKDAVEDRDAKRESMAAMVKMMCRGRKRGLVGILATQRLAKLALNVAAEASNYLIGATYLDNDIDRAMDALGMKKSNGEIIRHLSRGEFIGLGPAVSKSPCKVKIGAVQTRALNAAGEELSPLPTLTGAELESLLLPPDETEENA